MTLFELLMLLLIGLICAGLGVKLLGRYYQGRFINNINHSLYVAVEILRKKWSDFVVWDEQCKLKNQIIVHQKWLEALPGDLRNQVECQEFFITQYLYDRAQKKPPSDQAAIIRQSLELMQQYWKRMTPQIKTAFTIDASRAMRERRDTILQFSVDVQYLYNLVVNELGDAFSFYQLTLFVAAYRHRALYIDLDRNLCDVSQSYYLVLNDGDLISVPLNAEWVLGEYERLYLICFLISNLLIMRPSSNADAPLVQAYLDSRKLPDASLGHLRWTNYLTSDRRAADFLANFFVRSIKNDLRNKVLLITSSNTL